MFGRKKMPSNLDPLGRGHGPKKGHAAASTLEAQPKGVQNKVKRVGVPGQAKRAAFGDITNAKTDKVGTLDGKKKVVGAIAKVTTKKPAVAVTTKAVAKSKKTVEPKKENLENVPAISAENCDSKEQVPFKEIEVKIPLSLKEQNRAAGVPDDRVEEDFSFVEADDEEPLEKVVDKNPDNSEVLAFDAENYTDVYKVGIYAQDIFDYYKRREHLFKIPDYMSKKNKRITCSMRALLVDWMVEIQENFELNHETLYLGVKLTDTYLSRVPVKIDVLQLVGAAAIFIASKYDERCPPLIEDFTYISGNAFDSEEFVDMEMKMLKAVDFDLGVPISYRFLRRFAKVGNLTMETLTLARFILELSLMEYDLVMQRDSLIAAAALYIAMRMKDEGKWEGDLVKASGYEVADFKELIIFLNKMLHAPPVAKLSTIRSKYSHKMFHEVAKIPVLSDKKLL